MLASKYILRDKKGFDRVEKEGEIFQSDSFGLAYFNRKDKGDTLFGFIVSNKISPDSTQRNRVKRCLKEAARQNYGGVNPGYDVVFLAKQKVLRVSTENIMKEAKEAMIKTNILKI